MSGIHRKKAGWAGQRLLAEEPIPCCHKAEADKGAEGQRHGNSRGEQHVRSAEAPGAARGLRVTGRPCPGAEGGQGLLRGSVPGVKQAWATGSH